MKQQNTDVIQIAEYFPEQSFLEDQDATPVVAIESNLDEILAFQERIKGLGHNALNETKNRLLKVAVEFQNELPKENTNINDWHHEIFRLLELTRTKLKIISDLLTKRSQAS